MRTRSFKTFARLLHLVALLALLGAFGAFWWLDNQARRGIATGDGPAIAWTDVPQGGVNLPSLHFEQPDVIERTFATAAAAGFRWARVQFPWEDIEIHAKGDFRDYRHDYNGDGSVNEADAISAWDKYDRIVALAEQHQITLIVRLDRPPAWARQNLPQDSFRVAQRELDPGSTGPPDDYADYGDYVAAVVGRYQDRLQFFQLWNEPNYGHEWNWADPDPVAFVALLKLGYERAKAANPAAVLLFPALTPADGLDWQAMNDLAFLEAVYANGGGAYFDIFSAQLYGLGQPPDENRYIRLVRNAEGGLRRDLLLSRPLDSRTDVTRVVLLREIMVRYGDAHKPVWVSELGWNSHPAPHPFGGIIDEQQKAAYLVAMMERARREWPWMGVMNVWFLRSGVGFNPADPTVDFRLVREDWSTLPAYDALSAYLNAPPVAGPGAHGPTHPALRTTPRGWELRFWGDGIMLEGAHGPATLDGAPFNGSASDLALAEHTLSGSGPPPTGFRVTRAEPWRWPALLFPWLWLPLFAFALYRFLSRL